MSGHTDDYEVNVYGRGAWCFGHDVYAGKMYEFGGFMLHMTVCIKGIRGVLAGYVCLGGGCIASGP